MIDLSADLGEGSPGENDLWPLITSCNVACGGHVGDATLTYQWQHCDATGANCADIAGATSTTYVVQPTDAGGTLKVNETATNRFGTATGTSAVTAVVT